MMTDGFKVSIANGVRLLQRTCYSLAQSNGFHERWRSPLESLALITSEVGEADDRNIDLAGAILAKLEYNMSRPYKHGKKA